jgi:hypothetical protein
MERVFVLCKKSKALEHPPWERVLDAYATLEICRVTMSHPSQWKTSIGAWCALLANGLDWIRLSVFACLSVTATGEWGRVGQPGRRMPQGLTWHLSRKGRAKRRIGSGRSSAWQSSRGTRPKSTGSRNRQPISHPFFAVDRQYRLGSLPCWSWPASRGAAAGVARSTKWTRPARPSILCAVVSTPDTSYSDNYASCSKDACMQRESRADSLLL